MGLTTISYSETAKQIIYDQLFDLIGHITKIRSLCFKELSQNAPLKDDLVVFTAPTCLDFMLPFIDPRCRYITASRTISPHAIPYLFEIPSGSNVLVVNHQTDNSRVLVSELDTLGLDLSFYPYNPGDLHESNFTYAITPGLPELVPPGIPHVIDIGPRVISILTIAEILYYLTGTMTYDNLISTRYIKDLIKLSRDLSEQYRRNKLLRLELETVISNFEDGVIVTDLANSVTIHNTTAERILNSTDLQGKALAQVFPSVVGTDDKEFLQLGGRTVHLTRKRIESRGDHPEGELLILKDITEIQRIEEQYRIQQKNSSRRVKYTFDSILCRSTNMRALINKARRFAQTTSTVLITGESGTGKEMFAQAIHNASARQLNPFVAINCAALSETLLESELFGYEDGAFTGAKKGGKRGLFEQAHHGTIFLDEIGDAPPSIQMKLLRVLQEKEIMRVSGDRVIPVDVRVIASTNKVLRELVDGGLFRHDLLFRLTILPLHVPSLRERREDVEILLDHYISWHARRLQQPVPKLSQHLRERLVTYSWPGNVRELANIAEYLVNIAPVSEHLDEDVSRILAGPEEPPTLDPGPGNGKTAKTYFPSEAFRDEALSIVRILAEMEGKSILIGRKYLMKSLRQFGYNLSEQQVKTRLEALSRGKLIHCYVGKGSEITKEGRQFVSKPPSCQA